jgi:hypothetical protein
MTEKFGPSDKVTGMDKVYKSWTEWGNNPDKFSACDYWVKILECEPPVKQEIVPVTGEIYLGYQTEEQKNYYFTYLGNGLWGYGAHNIKDCAHYIPFGINTQNTGKIKIVKHIPKDEAGNQPEATVVETPKKARRILNA